LCLYLTEYPGKKPTNTKLLKIDDQEYEWVKGFKYLETVLTEYNDITTEIKQRRIMANKTSYGFHMTDQYCHVEVNVGPSQRRMEI
jgi:hypothetical protein